MKKSVCLVAVLGAFAASGAMAVNADDQQIDVKFKGRVITSECVVTPGDAGTVDLGTFNTHNESAPIVPVQFAFSNCKNAAEKMATVTLKRDGGDFPAQGNVAGHVISTNKQGINVEFYTDSTGGTKGMASLNDQNGKLDNQGNAAVVTVAYAKMVPTKTGQLNAGDEIKTVGVFEVTFN